MGKVRIKTLGDEAVEEQEKLDAKKRSEAKKAAKNEENITSSTDTTSTTSEKIEDKNTKARDTRDTSGTRGTSNKKVRSEKYLAKAAKRDKSQQYKLAEAVEILPSLGLGSFDETVELHINTNTSGLSGTLTLPHGTGKQTRVAIATEELISEIEKGTISFDVLIAEPMMMAKLAKVAKVLGPRGLMPNPKNGTVSPKPEEVAKKFENGQTNYKTEAKFPILHLSVGKVSFGPEKLSANIENAIQTIQKANIKNVTLKSTMSPALKLDITSI